MSNLKPHIMIIESRYYDSISDHLLDNARRRLDAADATYEIFTVPGALEIPAAISYAIKGLSFFTMRSRFDGYLARGCVIRGETTHYEIVANESARALQNLGTDYALAIGNAILTVENKQQAEARALAAPEGKDKGGEAAAAVLQMITMKDRFGLYRGQKSHE